MQQSSARACSGRCSVCHVCFEKGAQWALTFHFTASYTIRELSLPSWWCNRFARRVTFNENIQTLEIYWARTIHSTSRTSVFRSLRRYHLFAFSFLISAKYIRRGEVNFNRVEKRKKTQCRVFPSNGAIFQAFFSFHMSFPQLEFSPHVSAFFFFCDKFIYYILPNSGQTLWCVI